MRRLTRHLLILLPALLTAPAVQATVIPVATGFEVTYAIGMDPGTANGLDVEKVFLFEWNDTQSSTDHSFRFAARGRTFLSHVIPFAPTSALAIGYVPGLAGVGDGKDHIYMLADTGFAGAIDGLRWSEVFPGVPGQDRVRHSALVSLLIAADAGDAAALASLNTFVTTEAYAAAFDPAGGFSVIEYSNANVSGSSIPEPATPALMGLALLLAGLSIRRLSPRKR